MKTPADTGGGGGSTCGGDLLPRETRRRNFGGAEGFRGSPSDPQFRGTPKHSRPVASYGASGGYCMGPPIYGSGRSGVGATAPGPLGSWSSPCLDAESWALPHSRDRGWPGPSPPLCHVALWGPGRVPGVGGACPSGPLSRVPCCAIRPVTFTAAGALHRLRGGYGMASRTEGVSGEPGTRGPGYAAPPPPVSAGSSLPRPRGVAKFQSAARTFEKGTFCFRP